MISLSGALAEQDESLFSLKDLSIQELADAKVIQLTGDSITITEPGIYALSGSIDNGSVSINVSDDDTVYLLLNGVSITNSSGSALHIDNADKVILTLVEGTINTMTQGENEPGAKKNNAAIYSNCDLTINGSGTLIVNGGYRDGILVKDSLRIVSGTITVTAKEDGLSGKESLCIGGGTISIMTSGGDAVKSSGTDNEGSGILTICGGIINITTGNGSASVEFTAEEEFAFRGFGQTETVSSDSESDSVSLKGLKAETMIQILAGSITIDAQDDAIHSNGSIEIEGGVLTLSTGDDAIHADQSLTVSDGIINILYSYEGLEAAELHLDGGNISLYAFDDGINGAGAEKTETASEPAEMPSGIMPEGEMPEFPDGFDPPVPLENDNGTPPEVPDDTFIPESSAPRATTDMQQNGNMFDANRDFRRGGGMNFGMLSTSSGTLTITGGTITVISDGDGIDVNGDIVMSGGEVYVRGASNSMNAALDYDGSFTMTGGTLIGLGVSGMSQGVSNPAVPGTMVNISSGSLSVSTEAGTLLLSFDTEGTFNNAVIYSEQFTENESYIISSGDTTQTAVMTLNATTGGFGRMQGSDPGQNMPFGEREQDSRGFGRQWNQTQNENQQ